MTPRDLTRLLDEERGDHEHGPFDGVIDLTLADRLDADDEDTGRLRGGL